MNATLQVLGCGGSTGVPVPGCTCPVCRQRRPRNVRFRTSARLRLEDGRSILIDASADLRSIALAYSMASVDAVLYTHAHADHILGTDDLRSFNFAQRSSIPCYGSGHTIARLQQFFDYIFNPDPNYRGGGLAQLTTHPLTAYETVEILGVPVLPFELEHGGMPVLGFRFGSVAWAPDCNHIPQRSLEHLRDLDVLFLNGLRYEPHATHFSIPESIAIAQALAPKRCYLIHMTHGVDYEIVNPSLPSGIELAYDGLEVGVTW